MPTSAVGVQLGNYAEVKNSVIGAGTKSHHFSYLGDADVGERVNIGAGTITANYDGVRKHRTRIGDRAFIGSDTILRAPVSVGEDALTGAALARHARRAGRQDGPGRAGAHPRAHATPAAAPARPTAAARPAEDAPDR